MEDLLLIKYVLLLVEDVLFVNVYQIFDKCSAVLMLRGHENSQPKVLNDIAGTRM